MVFGVHCPILMLWKFGGNPERSSHLATHRRFSAGIGRVWRDCDWIKNRKPNPNKKQTDCKSTCCDIITLVLWAEYDRDIVWSRVAMFRGKARTRKNKMTYLCNRLGSWWEAGSPSVSDLFCCSTWHSICADLLWSGRMIGASERMTKRPVLSRCQHPSS